MKIRKLFFLKRYILKQFYIILNLLKFKILGIKYGANLRAYSQIFLDIHSESIVEIGKCVTMTSGKSYNPLARNLISSLCAEREGTILKIGDYTGISSSCIWAKLKIVIGNYVNIGADTIIMDSDAHSLDWKIRSSRKCNSQGESLDIITSKCAPIIIEDNVFIGTKCIILKGVTIGARSIIAAGSVVTHSIPCDSIAAGNPCKVIKKLVNK
jgi:acetyltransferase-like isoleucine patch superfamily enzyme